MAQRLNNITLGAPGFYGLNTEASPVELPPQFCTTADNCIIDKFGRLGARKGFNTLTDSAAALGGEKAKRIFEWNSSGLSIKFLCANNKIFRIDTVTNPDDTLTEMTLPGGYAGITADNWDFADFNQEGYFFQAGHEPLLVNATLNGTDQLDTLDNQSFETSPNAPWGNVVLPAFGRLWVSGVEGAEGTVYWSDTLIGDGFTEGFAGSIDITTVWPEGHDEIQALGVQNGRLIIFGRHSIVIYSGAEDPSTMPLEDTVSSAGCTHRDTVKNTGEDIIFLSATGLRFLSRTLQQSSLPLGEVSNNVRTQLIADVASESQGINSVYSPEEGFYLLVMESQSFVYCVDFKANIEGGRRITTWSGTPFNCFVRADDGTLYCGGLVGIGKYDGYNDDGGTYTYQYYSPALTFDNPGNLKFLKKIRPTIIGSTGNQATVSWGYGYNYNFSTQVVNITGGGALSEYGISEYGEDEYSSPISVSDEAINATGSGEEVTLGVSSVIDGSSFSLQQINVLALIGRLQ